VRIFSGDASHVRYLKVSEGCDHGCAFCAIPLMRGRHRSFAPDDVVREAQLLEAQGAREICLVAQDLAHYGRDRRGSGESLATLLESLVRDTTIPWIRMLYLYSAGMTPRLLELVASEPRIAPYFDMPMQHASDAVLKRMRRPERNRTIRDTVARIRDTVADVAIRTTCIVGFPGETDEDFDTLLATLEDVQFDRMGAFTYSAQEGTAAHALADDVPESVKLARLERVQELQRMISADRLERRVGTRAPAIIDAVGDTVVARTIWQAPEIDGVTHLAVEADESLNPGTIVEARIDAVENDLDLVASVSRILSRPSEATPRRGPRQLPLVSIGSYGR
jgi:ribosomal protein S12 methylthiotransferase